MWGIYQAESVVNVLKELALAVHSIYLFIYLSLAVCGYNVHILQYQYNTKEKKQWFNKFIYLPIKTQLLDRFDN